MLRRIILADFLTCALVVAACLSQLSDAQAQMPPAPTSTPTSTPTCPQTGNCGTVHPFIAFEGGGGWSHTNFAVEPNFGVNGSSFVGGINGGALIDIPGTIFSAGFRVGWQGGNMSGTVANQPASPTFEYGVRARSIIFAEGMIELDGSWLGQSYAPDVSDYSYHSDFSNYHVFVSAGVAEVHTQVVGTSGAFQVTDSANQVGFTGAVGVGVPISRTILGGELDAFTEYRGFILPHTIVNIPGPAQLDNQWIQSVNVGLRLKY